MLPPFQRVRRLLPALVAAIVAGLLGPVWLSSPTAAADPRLERAQQERARTQERLDSVLQRQEALRAEIEDLDARLAELEDARARQQRAADDAGAAVASRLRGSYQRGISDPAIALLASASPRQAVEQSRLLGMLARRDRADQEGAAAAHVHTHALVTLLSETGDRLRARQSELAEAEREAADLLARAEREEQQVRATIAAEREARERAEREARERAEREARERSAQRAARSSGSGAAAAPAADGSVACPVGRPHSYSDTYGAPRSGGRRHMGTDILAARGIPIYAYEDGTVTRMNSNRIGGISLHLRGDSGNQYYYTHLQGYVGGLNPGHRVSVGQQIAFNGDTGNARGIPHLHFEVRPGGGANVNPYPYVRRACG